MSSRARNWFLGETSRGSVGSAFSGGAGMFGLSKSAPCYVALFDSQVCYTSAIAKGTCESGCAIDRANCLLKTNQP